MNYNMYYIVPYEERKHFDLLFDFYSKKGQAEKLVHGHFSNPLVFRSYLELKFREDTWSDFKVLMKSDMAIGFGFLHDLRPNSCCLSIALFEKYQGSGAGVVLGWKMLKHIFSKYEGFNRVFAWVFDSNCQSLKLHQHAANRGWVEYHGRLPDQYMLSGVSYGTRIFSITREKFDMILSKVENRPTTY